MKNQLKKAFEKVSDFRERQLKAGSAEVTLFFVDSIASAEKVSEFVVKPLVQMTESEILSNLDDNIVGSITEKLEDVEAMTQALLNGSCLVFLKDNCCAWSVDARASEGRAVSEPPTSGVTKGPREGFTENLKTNMLLLKKRLKTADFKSENMVVGKYTATTISICFIEGVADEQNIALVKEKIQEICLDGIVDSSYVAKFLDSGKTTLFKMVGTSEKPDIVVAKLLEGRIAIVVDGSPIVLTVPYLFIEDLQSPEDYYDTPQVATFARILRLVSVIFAVLLPGLFVSLQLFNYQIMPSKFLITIVNAVEGIPFTPLIEMFVVLLIFDILREANSRMPKIAGLSLSVVGAIVLGDAAIKAGLLGAPAVMIGALSGIGLYTMPENTLLFTLLRFAVTIVGGMMGIFGVLLATFFVISFIVDLSAFKTPYLAPYAPSIKSDKKDGLFKKPLNEMKERPKSFSNENPVRQGDNNATGTRGERDD